MGAGRRRPRLLPRVRPPWIRARNQRLPVRAHALTPRPRLLAAGALAVFSQVSALAQGPDDTRTQYPALLQNSYITISVGAVDQSFSQEQIQPGFHAGAI